MKRILVCEDEDVIRDFVVINLRRAGYDVIDVSCGEDALRVFDEEKGNFDIALLDIMMPGIDGFQVCKVLRAKSTTLGIVMLSAKTQEIDKVSGLMIGADDYITKPFSPSELTARVDAIYRRVQMSVAKDNEANDDTTIESGPFTLNFRSRTVTKSGVPIDLTQVEFQIMEYFLNNQETALDRTSILTNIWGESYFGDDKIVDVNIRRIRMKIEDEPSNPKYISTIWGFGYKWSPKAMENKE
ncbi:MAG: response regulator transcription factor [Oscillospiraceae bacterium]|nr:response regulator transcription factor [Oscillospiraceae bacterium]